MAEDLAVIIALVFLITLSIVGLVVVYAARYKRVPPNQAMVVFGRRYSASEGFQVVMGGGRFIMPIIESYRMISLEPMLVELLVEDIVGNVTGPAEQVRRLQVSVSAIARISDDVDRLKRVAGRLVHKSLDEVRNIVEKTLEGHVRGVLATEPHPEHDLSRTSETIRLAADQDLSAMGIEVRSLFIRIRDADSMQRKEVGGVDKMNRELHQMDLRVRRIEEKMGFSVSGHPP